MDKLQPMNVGEILDRTFKMYGEQFKSYLTIAALGMAAVFVVFLAFGLFFPVWGPLVQFLVSIVATLAIYGAITKKASLQIMDRSIGVADAYRFSSRRVLSLFAGALLFGVVFLIGSILLVIPGIYVFVSFSLFIPALIIEDLGPWRSLGRSRRLVRGSWWRVLGILLLITILVGVLVGIIEVPLYLFLVRNIWTAASAHRPVFFSMGAKTALQIVYLIVGSFTAPFSAIAYTLLYYDLRIRKEDLDLEAMVDNLTGTDGPVAGLQG